MADLEAQLVASQAQRYRIIVTDGVFSMDGIVASLDKICDLADKYDALVMVDECHATGFIGATGKGTLEAKGVMGRVDIITGTLGKALGGGMPIFKDGELIGSIGISGGGSGENDHNIAKRTVENLGFKIAK